MIELAARRRLVRVGAVAGARPAPLRPVPRAEAKGDAKADAKSTRATAYVMLLVVIAALNLVGLVMVMSASAVLSIRNYGSPWHYSERQAMWVALGSVAFLVALRVDYHKWRRLAGLALVASYVGLLAVLVPGVGVTVSGATRWLGTSSVQIQPSEFAKMALVLWVAHILDRRGDHPRWAYRAAPALLVLVTMVGLVMLQPDMGTSMVMTAIVLGVLFCAGLPGRALGAIGVVGVMGGFAMALAAPYRWARMTSFLHPQSNATSSGYQAYQGLLSIGSGHFLGSGLGTSIASWGYLPNQQTDFIFAVIAQETGLVGSLFVVALFATLALVGVRTACRAPDRYGALVAGGITAWLVCQAVINVGAVVGLLPVTGVPLPFVSFGGSSVVIALFGAGVLANVARQA